MYACIYMCVWDRVRVSVCVCASVYVYVYMNICVACVYLEQSLYFKISIIHNDAHNKTSRRRWNPHITDWLNLTSLNPRL